MHPHIPSVAPLARVFQTPSYAQWCISHAIHLWATPVDRPISSAWNSEIGRVGLGVKTSATSCKLCEKLVYIYIPRHSLQAYTQQTHICTHNANILLPEYYTKLSEVQQGKYDSKNLSMRVRCTGKKNKCITYMKHAHVHALRENASGNGCIDIQAAEIS